MCSFKYLLSEFSRSFFLYQVFLFVIGYCKVDETEKGWFIQYIDRDPLVLQRQKELEKQKAKEKDDEERQARFIYLFIFLVVCLEVLSFSEN